MSFHVPDFSDAPSSSANTSGLSPYLPNYHGCFAHVTQRQNFAGRMTRLMCRDRRSKMRLGNLCRRLAVIHRSCRVLWRPSSIWSGDLSVQAGFVLPIPRCWSSSCVRRVFDRCYCCVMSCPACVACGLRVAQQLHEQHVQMNQRHEEEVKELEDRESEHEAWRCLLF